MKSVMYMFAAFVAILAFGIIASAHSSFAPKSFVSSSGEVQDVKLRFENYQYVMEPSSLKAGVPVRIEVDLSSVYGCMRDIVIPQFNVRKYVGEGDNIVEFTPDRTGTFWIVCSMNMGRGQFSVAEAGSSASGSKASDYIEPAPTGGCGCGGRNPGQSQSGSSCGV